eukprot:CAMPEP_0202462768 /NCGR_PEP_ID=MMETSP1360-20130828/55355_1 /ASSEMBLY_ACC=CAM_ASM_000848 /TAXON_ID=515479 /ORGANISM="Licmophora paradoxa, Strain CCMP2313" /LENGTH=34 /DNA_ID= /DNA_START= /DNA_END= /DNA_ORIENTATION=
MIVIMIVVIMIVLQNSGRWVFSCETFSNDDSIDL